MRSGVERELRNQKFPNEITLEEIYEKLSVVSGIDKEDGMRVECELEYAHCKANPYFLDLFNKLKQMGKLIIITSDMYLPKSTIEAMLHKCGFSEYHALYVSSDLGITKASGELYRYITQIYGNNKSYIHIGDNLISDMKNAREAGWSSYYYMDVHKIGKPFRPNGMSSLGGGFYRGLINTYLYNGCSLEDKYYDLGYTYFGILVYGYCQWLNQIAKQNSVSKILFVSRDMYIIKNVYESFFGDYPSEYITASRLAIIRADFKKSSEMFFTCMRDAYTFNPNITIEEYFTSINFEFFIPLLKESNLLPNMAMSPDVCDILENIILDKKDIILQNLITDHSAAIEYFSNVIQDVPNSSSVLLADMNGRCTSLTGIQHILDDIGKNIHLIGAQMYSASDKGFVEIKFTDGTLESFLFSYINNRSFYNIFKRNGINRTRVIEAIFTEPTGTLLSYVRDFEGNFKQGLPPEHTEKLAMVHKGIFDFCAQYFRNLHKLIPITITPYDSFIPMNQIIDRIPREFPELLNDMTLGN